MQARAGVVLFHAVVLAVSGLWLLTDGLRESHRREHIFDHGTEVEAVIWGHRDANEKNKFTYKLDLRFRADERTQIVIAPVSRDLYERSDQWNHIRIKYLETDPEEVVVLDDGDPLRGQFWLSGLLLVVASVLGFIGMRLRDAETG